MLRLLTFILVLFFSFYASAFTQEVNVDVITAKKHLNFPVGIGSKVRLTFSTDQKTKEAIFLGRLVNQENETEEYLFLDEIKTRILMIDSENIVGLRKSSTEAIVRPINQQGSTCAAYGFFHFWNQIYASGFNQSENLTQMMSSDRTRLQFLEEAIDIYYLQNRNNITNIMKLFGKRFGFSCRSHHFNNSKDVSEFLFNKSAEGRPLLIDFNIGPDMVSSTYEIKDYENPTSIDPRLWIPRQVGQRTAGGHVIVAAGSFISRGKKKLLILDSDWSEPRVWDLEKYVARKAAYKEIGVHSCQ
jgi:hypothetical protein